MKRWFLAGLLALAIPMALAGTAAANKNKGAISATCDGTSVTAFVNFRANNNSALPTQGGGSFKATEGQFFIHGTTTEAFSFTTNFPHAPTVTCTGSFVDPASGDLLDFIVKGVPRPGR